MKLPMPRPLWRWIDRRGRFPRWIKWVWPGAHFCGELGGRFMEDVHACRDWHMYCD